LPIHAVEYDPVRRHRCRVELRVVEVDASTVTVWNDTNGSYFARVVVG
jgi:hypothetical protein